MKTREPVITLKCAARAVLIGFLIGTPFIFVCFVCFR